MKHLFVPYELALKLKEKGFGDETFYEYYKTSNGDIILEPFISSHLLLVTRNLICMTSAPTHQQAVDWFRENHGLLIYVVPFKDHAADVNDPFEWNWAIHGQQIGRGITSYYNALNEAIEHALELI